MKQSKCLAYDSINLNSLNVPFYFVQHIWYEQKLKLNLTGCLVCEGQTHVLVVWWSWEITWLAERLVTIWHHPGWLTDKHDGPN